MPYAVAIGRERKVVETWKECKRLTDGYPRAKFKKVADEEEGKEFIEKVVESTVLSLGYESKQFGVRSTIPYINTMTNTTLTIRTKESFVEGLTYNSIKVNVYCIILTHKELPLPSVETEHWEKRNKYLFTREFEEIGINKNLATIKFLTDLITLIRDTVNDSSILINTDSNYLIELLRSRIDYDLEVMSYSKVTHYSEILSLYDQVRSLEGLYLNYENNTHKSSEGAYLDLIMKE